jgi:hypothetical protein
MSFDTTNIYKIYETPKSQIYRFVTPQINTPTPQQTIQKATVDFECPTCKTKTKIQANLEKGVAMEPGAVPFPKDNIFICPTCSTRNDLSSLRAQIESQAKKKIF